MVVVIKLKADYKLPTYEVKWLEDLQNTNASNGYFNNQAKIHVY